MAERKSAARAAAELDAEMQRERADGWMARALAAERELEQLREVKQRVRDEIDALVTGTISPAVAVTNIVRALDGGEPS